MPPTKTSGALSFRWMRRRQPQHKFKFGSYLEIAQGKTPPRRQLSLPFHRFTNRPLLSLQNGYMSTTTHQATMLLHLCIPPHHHIPHPPHSRSVSNAKQFETVVVRIRFGKRSAAGASRKSRKIASRGLLLPLLLHGLRILHCDYYCFFAAQHNHYITRCVCVKRVKS